MKKRHPNPRLVKIHRNYTVEEAACLLKVHKHTVRNWIKQGLPVLSEKRPKLILGKELLEFLQTRRKKNKRPCKPDEMYCLRCRIPKKPAGGMVDYEPTTDNLGNLLGICPDCNGFINRRTSIARLDQIQRFLDITLPQGMERIGESSNPSLNCNFGKGGKNRANL